MSPSTATRPHPRVQQRRAAVRRAEGRRRLRVLLAALGAFSVAGAAWLLVNSSFLDVDRVDVEGASRTRPEEAVAVAAVEPGEPLLLVDRGAVARRVERLPWVAAASVRWDLPGRLVVEITEREAVAWVDLAPDSESEEGDGAEGAEGRPPEAGESEVALVDADGRVLARRAVPPPNLVELRLDLEVPEPGAEVGGADDALEMLAAMPRSLHGRVTALERAEGEGYRLSADAVEVILFGPVRDVARKWAALEAVLRELADRSVYLVDLRAPAVPAVREREAQPDPEPDPDSDTPPGSDPASGADAPASDPGASGEGTDEDPGEEPDEPGGAPRPAG